MLALGYEAWGEGLLPRLRGAFFLVVWDRTRGCGLLVRDQLGAAPVFLQTGTAELLFASEVRILLALLSAAVAAATFVAPRAYSAVFPTHASADESQAIALTRRVLGLSGVQLALRGGSALAAALEFMEEWPVPPASPNWFIWAPLMRRAAAYGMVALLDGEGGDELFEASPALLADLLRAGRPVSAMRMARRIPGMGNRPPARWIARALRQYGLRAALPRDLHLLLRRSRGSERPGARRLRPGAARLQRDTERAWDWKALDGRAGGPHSPSLSPRARTRSAPLSTCVAREHSPGSSCGTPGEISTWSSSCSELPRAVV